MFQIPEPPQELVSMIGGGMETGKSQVTELKRMLGLRPEATVLEVGCGVGRTAIPLTAYISPPGAYEGFDVWPEGVGWCRQEITCRHPHFSFTAVDVFNAAYNPQGRIDASDFTFPYEDQQFDFAFLYSVFTHVLPAALKRYLLEIRRVLKSDGRVLATFFLVNAESLHALELAARAAGAANLAQSLLDNDFGVYRSGHPVSEEMVAYDEEFVRGLYRKSRLVISEPVSYGTWIECVDESLPVRGSQDTIIASR